MIDLITMKALAFDENSKGADVVELEIPEELKAEAEAARNEMIEAIAERDEEILEAFMESPDLDANTLKRAIRRATISGELVAVICGSSLKNKGIQPILNAVVDYLPSPLIGLLPKGSTL